MSSIRFAMLGAGLLELGRQILVAEDTPMNQELLVEVSPRSQRLKEATRLPGSPA